MAPPTGTGQGSRSGCVGCRGNSATRSRTCAPTCSYTVIGRYPVLTVQRDDLQPPKCGWQWCVIKLGILRLPFVSYSGRRSVLQLGWQPSGFFGAKATGWPLYVLITLALAAVWAVII